RLGGVQVFRPLIVVEQLSCTEADGLARDIADRPHQPSAEAVIDAALALRDQPGTEQLVARASLRGERIQHRVPAPWCVPHPEMSRSSGVEAAFSEETPARLGLRRQQLASEELSRSTVRGVQPAATAGLGGGAAVFIVQGVAE